MIHHHLHAGATNILTGKASKAVMAYIVAYYTQYTVHSTQYTVHSTQYTVHSTQYTVHSTQYTVHSTQYTVHSTQYTVHSTQYTVHSTQYTVHSTQYTVHSTQYTVHSTQYTVHSTQYTVHSTQYTVHSTQYTVHTIYGRFIFPQGIFSSPLFFRAKMPFLARFNQYKPVVTSLSQICGHFPLVTETENNKKKVYPLAVLRGSSVVLPWVLRTP